MALTARSIITSNEFKDYMGIARDNFEKETFVEQVIDLCSGSIEDSIDTEVNSQAQDLIFDGNGSKVLSLGRYIEDLFGADDTARLANLQSRSDSESAWEDLTDSMDNVEFDGRTIQLLDTVFPVGRKNIRVKFYAGFDPVPAKLKKVCLEMCAMMWKESNQGDGRLGLGTSSGSGAGSLSYKDMQERWDAVLNEYVENTPNVSVIYI